MKRGYSEQELQEHLLHAYEFADRDRLLKSEGANKGGQVLALKLPFTPRTAQLRAPALVKSLHEAAASDPAVSRSLGDTRWLVAHTRTPTLLGKLRAR